jgi:two-component system LytT family response regulator
MRKDQFSVVIIDDEKECINNLIHSLSKFDELKVVGTSQNPEKGKELIMIHKPDLLFVDVEMPDTTGIELIRDIKDDINWNMQVVFYTAYDKYLLDALRESAFDYLLKPYEEKNFNIIISRFFQYVSTENNNKFKSSAALLYEKDPEYFLLTTIKGYRKIKVSEVGFFEYDSLRRVWSIILENEQIKLKRNTKASNIIKLSPAFVQINQHEIVNMNLLSSIENKKCKMLSPFDKCKDLIISRKYSETVEDKFMIL